MSKVEFSELKGKTIVYITRQENDRGGSEAILIDTSDGEKYSLHHDQDCCESVHIEDIVGDLNDLIGNPLLEAEEVTNSDEPKLNEYDDCYTWSYYKLGTIKGHVSIRFYGTSNGYYSETADLHVWKTDPYYSSYVSYR